MRKLPGSICHAMTLVLMLTVLPGCVKRMSAANAPLQGGAVAVATLQSISVSDDGSRVEVTSDRPLTYTSYKASQPAKIIVDISQAEPGAVAKAISVDRGHLSRIEVQRQPIGGGVLTRLELSLVKDVEFTVNTDPANKSKLLLLLPQSGVSQPQAESKPEPVREEPAAALQPEGKVVTAIVAAKEGGEPVVPESKVTASPASSAAEQPANEQLDSQRMAKSEAPVLPEVPAATKVPQQETKTKSKAVTAITADADGIEVAVDGTVETFNSFKLTKPDRIVVDIFGTRSNLSQKVVRIGALGVSDARIGLTPDKARIVLDAQSETLSAYEVVKTDAGLKIRFKSASVPKAAASEAAVSFDPVAAPEPAPTTKEIKAVAKEPKPAASQKGTLEALDFTIVDGVSRISLKLHGNCRALKPVRVAQGFTLSIPNCQVPKKLQRAVDTSAFGTQVLSVTPYQLRSNGGAVTKLMVKVKGNPHFTMHQDGDTVLWDFTNLHPPQIAKLPVPVAKAAPAAAKEGVVPAVDRKIASAAIDEELSSSSKVDDGVTEITATRTLKRHYKGRRVTLEFSDADVRKIFQLIAEVSNLNFLISDDVSGTISLKLVNVPWDQALDVILDAKALAMVRDGNIVQIKPRSKVQSIADEELAARKAAERTMDMHTMVFEVNYASVSDVAAQFATVKSDRGTISKDDRTSRVIVKDIQPALDDMRQLLKTLDAPEKQVMIEARIVEASSNFTRDLGVQWGLHYKDGSASFANINAVDTGFGGVVAPTGPGSVGTGGMALGMSFGTLTSNIQLDMRLSAAATIGQVKIISTPKVVTLNNKAAKISQGQSIPYQTTSAEGTKTEFVEAALTLEVTPHITADGAVSMKIKASNNSPGSGTPPPINKKEATTELLVANGETTVIGGIYVDSDSDTDTGVPFLSDIPLLGWLFKSNTKTKLKTELLIFITPKIVS